ncbi:MAG: RES domain-containing protein [Anaerobutyricum sp.]
MSNHIDDYSDEEFGVTVMGYAKNDMMNVQERGYGHSDKIVCAGCFGDPFLKNYIKKHGEYGSCSFCKDSNDKARYKKVMPLEELMPVIMNVINRDYLDAHVALPWDSETKSLLGDTFDPWDFVTDELNQYLECENGKVLLALENILPFEDRCSRYEFSRRQDEIDLQEWNKFCYLVQTSTLSAEQIVTECYRKRASDNLKAIRTTMEKIISYLKELNMTERIRPEDTIFRCGTHIGQDFDKKYDIPVIPATLMGTAPPLLTNHNRMSEKGDMMFYGAFKENVAVAEIGTKKDQILTTAKFHTNKIFKVLNLSTLNRCNLPSLFDVEQDEKRSAWFFLMEFMRNISMPVSDFDDKIKEYKPTQVFTKYIQRKTTLAGIVYPSSKFAVTNDQFGVNGERCVVLFVTNRDCIEEEDTSDRSRKQLIMEPNPVQRVVK